MSKVKVIEKNYFYLLTDGGNLWYYCIIEGGVKMKERRPLVFQKNADKAKNKVVIPQFFINKHGNRFYMEVYEDKIILKPIAKGE